MACLAVRQRCYRLSNLNGPGLTFTESAASGNLAGGDKTGWELRHEELTFIDGNYHSFEKARTLDSVVVEA